MWNSFRMKGNMPLLNVITAHKIPINIIQHLITINIAVIIWRRNGLWMIIVNTGTKTAHHKGRSFECLMYRWRLMYASRYRLKIMDRKTPREVVTIPTYYIKRMRGINDL